MDMFSLFRRKLILSGLLPLVLLTDVLRLWFRLRTRLTLRLAGKTTKPSVVDATSFPNESGFGRILAKLESTGLRSTGSAAHEKWIQWIENELHHIPGLSVNSQDYDILRWQTGGNFSLENAAALQFKTTNEARIIPIVGAIPYSKPCSNIRGDLVYLPQDVTLTESSIKGKVVIRDFGANTLPTALAVLPSYRRTMDLNVDLLGDYDRPGIAAEHMVQDLLNARGMGAVGVIIAFDIPREQMESYWEPHFGIHYRIPAIFVGVDEAEKLKYMAKKGAEATLTVRAEVSKAPTRNVVATLPSQIEERVVFVSHTDGNTLVRENGVLALLTLAKYFSSPPRASRRRTIEFAFNTAHLHISQEGSHRQAREIGKQPQNGNVVLLIATEHMGTREIEAYPRKNGLPGRQLALTGRGETMVWCVGPSPTLVDAVEQAVARRNLDYTLVTRGTTRPDYSRSPEYTSFGGIGTYYHNLLIPTTSLISGPWSLWAPVFGIDAIDISRLRSQTLALGDVYLSIDYVSRDEIASGYIDYWKNRDEGRDVYQMNSLPEQAAEEFVARERIMTW